MCGFGARILSCRKYEWHRPVLPIGMRSYEHTAINGAPDHKGDRNERAGRIDDYGKPDVASCDKHFVMPRENEIVLHPGREGQACQAAAGTLTPPPGLPTTSVRAGDGFRDSAARFAGRP